MVSFYGVMIQCGVMAGGDDDDGGGDDGGNLNVMTDDCDARPEVFEKRETEKWTDREEGWR